MGYLFSWISLSKSVAESGLDDSEILIIVAGLLLTLGAIGEYLEDHKKFPGWFEWPKLVFILMVVVGLVGEFFGDAGVFVFSGALQSISDTEVANLNKEAGAARREAGDANKAAGVARDEAANTALRAGKLEVQAAALRKQAEDEAMSRAKIEGFLSFSGLFPLVY